MVTAYIHIRQVAPFIGAEYSPVSIGNPNIKNSLSLPARDHEVLSGIYIARFITP